MKKQLFVIYDNFNKQGIIPNGFNMSEDEVFRHRYNLPGKSNVNFAKNYLLDELDNVIPIHIGTYKSNRTFFQSNGTVIYPISLTRRADSYYELFNLGMNNWLNYLDPRVIDSVKHDGVKLVLSCLFEIFLLQDIRNVLREALVIIGSLDNVEIWTPWTIPKEELDSQMTTDLHKSVVDVPFWEIRGIVLEDYDIPYDLVRRKKFINLNRRYTEDRAFTHLYIINHDLLDEGYVSMPPFNPTKSLQSLNDYVSVNVPSKFGYFVQDEIDKVKIYWQRNSQGNTLDMAPINDTQRTHGSKSYYGFPEKSSLKSFFNDSYFSLINEGEFFNGENYLITEKTIRAIMFKHLFIIIGPRGILQSLKAKGYKTFSSLWPEDYDDIVGDANRILRALEIFEDIMKNKDIKALYNQAYPILEYNRNLALERARSFKNKYSS